MKKISKKYTAVLISLLTFAGVAIVLACSPVFESDNANYRFLSQDVVNNNAYRPFYRSLNTFFSYGYGYLESPPPISIDSINLDEWHDFFAGKIQRSELEFLIYKLPLSDLDPLLMKLKDINYQLKPELQKYAVINTVDKKTAREFLYYLGFAKRIEPLALLPGTWTEETKPEDITGAKAEMEKLTAAGLKQINNSSIPYIHQRYELQILRLYFYSGHYQECAAYYETLSASKRLSKSVNYRMMGYAAGSARALKQISKANYLYAKIFDEFDAMKISAYLSFRPQEEDDWKQCLSLAKSPRETCALWQLLGIKFDGFRAMKEIYKLDPSTDLLDLLIVRQISMEEENFLPERWNYAPSRISYAIKPGTVNAELLSFIHNAADKGGTHKPALWDMAYGYICLAQKDYAAAREYFSRAGKKSPNDLTMQAQLRIFNVVMRVEEAKTINENFENSLLTDLQWLYDNRPYNIDTVEGIKYGGAMEWILNRLSDKYTAQGDFLKAEISRYGCDTALIQQPAKLEKLAAFLEKSSHTSFEKMIMNYYPYTLNDVYDMLGINAFYKNDLEAAIKYFGKIETGTSMPSPLAGSFYSMNNDGRLFHESDELKAPLPGDPFIIHTKDCHDCDHGAPQSIKYTKLDFVTKIFALLKQIEDNPPNAAELCFQAANGFYNASYFGNARMFYETTMRYYGTWYRNYPATEVIFDLTNAEKYYERALRLSNNPEFKAKCCFMLAKCENNRFSVNKDAEDERDFIAGQNFARLKNEFSGTKYYQEILRECGYFRTYIGK